MNELFDTPLTSFEDKALESFAYQSENCLIYKQYLSHLNIKPSKINTVSQIPFLPIEFFKTHKVISGENEASITFVSIGTTGQSLSKHYITDIAAYENSFLKGFKHFFGKIEDYRILALLPSYLEREGSSLVYMCQQLINKSGDDSSGFYLDNYEELATLLSQRSTKKTMLIGVSYALLDLAEQFPQPLENTIVMETGGMKGKRPEKTKNELHKILKHAFQVDNIHSEYGMTELLSQAYSFSDGVFQTPRWMKVVIRDPQDPISLLAHHQVGGINVIDLANINSCCFIATQDLGKTISDTHFEVHGRLEASDIRGCNLLVQ